MDGVSLLRRAGEAGLRVAAQGNKLVIRGPRRAEPVVRLLLTHKPAVIAALAANWRVRHREALAHWSTLHSTAQAARRAWGEMEDRWYRLHGARVPPWQCAGCDAPIGLDFAPGPARSGNFPVRIGGDYGDGKYGINTGNVESVASVG